MIKRIKFPFPKNASFKPRPRRASCSSIIAASISAISYKTLSESIPSRRRYARFSTASSCRPTEASQRGDSYSNITRKSLVPTNSSESKDLPSQSTVRRPWYLRAQAGTRKVSSICWRLRGYGSQRHLHTFKFKINDRESQKFDSVLTVDKVWNHNADSNLGSSVNARSARNVMSPTMIWKIPVIRPRTSFGEHSET